MAQEIIFELGPNTLALLQSLAESTPPPPGTTPDLPPTVPQDPVFIYDQPGGAQSAPVYQTNIKGNGKLEPSEKIEGRVGHGNQVLLLVFPDNMAATFVKADWWYMFVVGVGITGWVKKRDGRKVLVRTE